jgi:hypothetical protein
MKWNYLVLLLFTLSTMHAQEQLPPVFSSLEAMSVEDISTLTGFEEDSAELVLSTLAAVRNWTQRKTFSGDVNFGFFGSTTRSGENNLFNIYGGFNVDWEMYPGNLDFSTIFGITYNDNKLQQNLSAIDVSYDHLHREVGNGMLLENFIYVNRATNAYLGIDQRYEIGGGIIINNWIRKLVPPADESFPITMDSEGNDAWNDWLDDVSPGLEDKERNAFRDGYKEAYVKNRMANSKLRTALLIGLYFELEETTVQDSVQLPVTNKFRWSLRPTFDVQLKDGWSMKLRTYFKMPVPWQWKEEVEAPDGSVISSETDYFVNLNAAVSSKLMSNRVEVSFIYNLQYDNAPARTYYPNADGGYILLTNNDLNQSFRVALKVSLDKQ